LCNTTDVERNSKNTLTSESRFTSGRRHFVANFFNSNRKIRPKRRNTSGTRRLFLTPTERLGPKAGTHPVHDLSHGFFLGGKTQNLSTSDPRALFWCQKRCTSSTRQVLALFWFSSARRPHFSRVPDVDRLHPREVRLSPTQNNNILVTF
jgi:hypothetical protein